MSELPGYGEGQATKSGYESPLSMILWYHTMEMRLSLWKWKPGEIYDGKLKSLIGRFPVGVSEVVTHTTKLEMHSFNS